MTERYYTLDVASANAGVNPSTVRRWISEGKLHSLIDKGRRYVTLQAVCDARDAPIRHRLLNKARE